MTDARTRHPRRRAGISLLAVVAFLLTACAPTGPSRMPVATGEVYHVDKKGVTLLSNSTYLFVKLENANPLALKKLKKGQKLTLYGKPVHDADDPHTQTVELEEIVLDNGKRISLTN